MSDQERREHLFLVTDNMLEKHQEWQESDSQQMTEEFAQAIDECLEVFEHGGIPHDCRALARSVETLEGLWQRYKADATLSSDPYALPGGGFWKAIEVVEDFRAAAVPRRPAQLEPIAELTAQKVGDNQICRMYGWVESNGQPQLWKLREERAKPGTHVTADFVAPQERSRREADEKQAETIRRIREQRAQKLENLTREAPESIEDLLLQGVSVKQICKTKKCTKETVLAEAARLGLPEPMLDYVDPRATRAPQEPGINEAAERSLDAYSRAGKADPPPEPRKVGRPKGSKTKHSKTTLPPAPRRPTIEDDDPQMPDEPPPTLEQEILMYASQGMSPDDVAVSVSTEDVPVPTSKVLAILERAKHDPQLQGV